MEQPIFRLRLPANGLMDPREVIQPPGDGALIDFDEESDLGDSTAARVVGEGATGADDEEAGSEEDEESDDEEAVEDSDTLQQPKKTRKKVWLTAETAPVMDNLEGYKLLEGVHHKRDIQLPEGFYDQPRELPPLVACVSRCEGGRHAETCPANCDGGNGVRYDLPLLFFRLFFTDYLLKIIVGFSNEYAVFQKARNWKELTVGELKIWLGLVIYMSVIRQADTAEYWSTSSELPQHPIVHHIGRECFKAVKRYLHLSKPVESLSKSRFFEKVKPVADELRRLFKLYVTPRTEVSIDEIMVRFTGRSSHTIMVRGKPIPVGYYVLALCDAGYCYSFALKSPVTGYVDIDISGVVGRLTAAQQAVAGLLPPTSRAVVWLISQLPLATHFFTLYCDNLFSSCKLFHVLRAMGVAATGTARSWGSDWPKALSNACTKASTILPHNWQLFSVQHGDTCAIIWQDKNLVQGVTTSHWPSKMAEKERKKPRGQSTLAKRLRETVWAGLGCIKLSVPVWSIDYNLYMGGVDIHDQLRSYSSTQLKSVRAWYALFFNMLDMAIMNAFVICRQLHPRQSTVPPGLRSNNTKDKPLFSQRQFRLRLAWCLVLSGYYDNNPSSIAEMKSDQSGVKRKHKGQYANGSEPQGNSAKARRNGYVTSAGVLPIMRRFAGSHELS